MNDLLNISLTGHLYFSRLQIKWMERIPGSFIFGYLHPAMSAVSILSIPEIITGTDGIVNYETLNFRAFLKKINI